MHIHRRDFDKCKCMYFLAKKLLEKYNEIRMKVSNISTNEFDNNPVHNEKYIKTKIKSYNGEIYVRNFHNN